MIKRIWLIALILIVIDQASKIYIKTQFHYNEEVVVFDWFRLHFIENPGMAYGIEFGGYYGKVVLSILRLILISVGVYYIPYWLKKGNAKYLWLPISLIAAGAIGNLVDSTFYGLLFDKGLVYDAGSEEFLRYYGLAQMNAEGYAGLFGGCVVDMLYFPLIETDLPSWAPQILSNSSGKFIFFSPIFNIADSCIFIGVVLLFFSLKKAFPEVNL